MTGVDNDGTSTTSLAGTGQCGILGRIEQGKGKASDDAGSKEGDAEEDVPYEDDVAFLEEKIRHNNLLAKIQMKKRDLYMLAVTQDEKSIDEITGRAVKLDKSSTQSQARRGGRVVAVVHRLHCSN